MHTHSHRAHGEIPELPVVTGEMQLPAITQTRENIWEQYRALRGKLNAQPQASSKDYQSWYDAAVAFGVAKEEIGDQLEIWLKQCLPRGKRTATATIQRLSKEAIGDVEPSVRPQTTSFVERTPL